MSDFEVRWIEKLTSQKDEIEKLARDLGIHPLAVEDCLHHNQRAKFEDFDNHQLLVWFAFLEGEVYELEFVIFPHILMLVVADPPPKGNSWKEYLGIGALHSDAYHMLHQALDRSLDYSFHNVRPLFTGINEFEQTILDTSADPHILLELKSKIARAEYALSFLSPVVAQWQRFLNPKDDLRWRLRDLWDHGERIHQALIFHRTQIASAMEMYWGVTAKRTNDQIKKLTLIASISVPMTFWASFWGMNFEALPFRSDKVFVLAIVGMLLSVVATYFLLKSKGFWEK